jgi:hypothetical protein
MQTKVAAVPTAACTQEYYLEAERAFYHLRRFHRRQQTAAHPESSRPKCLQAQIPRIWHCGSAFSRPCPRDGVRSEIKTKTSRGLSLSALPAEAQREREREDHLHGARIFPMAVSSTCVSQSARYVFAPLSVIVDDV